MPEELIDLEITESVPFSHDEHRHGVLRQVRGQTRLHRLVTVIIARPALPAPTVDWRPLEIRRP